MKGPKPFFEKQGGDDREKPAEDADAHATKLGKELASAGGDKLERLLTELGEGKGAAYTQALADAIPKLEGDTRKKAREVLADRLSRMTSETLGAKLTDSAVEVRRAAALAVAMKEDKAHVGRLIELLNDEEMTVSRAAYAALKDISGQDFGPSKDASAEDRAKAIMAWKEWWAKQQEKR
jgi:hypothetical protein